MIAGQPKQLLSQPLSVYAKQARPLLNPRHVPVSFLPIQLVEISFFDATGWTLLHPVGKIGFVSQKGAGVLCPPLYTETLSLYNAIYNPFINNYGYYTFDACPHHSANVSAISVPIGQKGPD